MLILFRMRNYCAVKMNFDFLQDIDPEIDTFIFLTPLRQRPRSTVILFRDSTHDHHSTYANAKQNPPGGLRHQKKILDGS